MADLSTSYMGIALKNPLIVASSNLTSTVEKIKQCEQAGAGAVVLKSIFEEQIDHDTRQITKDLNLDYAAEAYDYIMGMSGSHTLDEYLTLAAEAKNAVSIPVIGSINAVSQGNWIEYAQKLEKVGIDGLELNLFIMPADANRGGSEIEEQYLAICRMVKQAIKIPVAIKMGFHFSGMAQIIQRISATGIEGLVLFNRFYRPDIDIDAMKLKAAPIFSAPEEMALSLQWIAILSGQINSDLAAATGIHDSKGVIKQLLAGAKAVQLCTTLYKNKVEYLATMLKEMEEWMSVHHFDAVQQFQGKLNQESIDDPTAYERSQYIKAIVGIK